MDDNGILTQVGGVFISDGMRQLPSADSVEPGTERTAMLDVPHLGQVSITYRSSTFKHGRSRRWHWRAVRADPAVSSQDGPEAGGDVR